MLYQQNQLQLPPQPFLLSTWVLPTPAPVASTFLKVPQLPTTTHVLRPLASLCNCSKRVPRMLICECQASFSFRSSPSNNGGPCHAIIPPYTHPSRTFANQACKIIFDKTSVTVFNPDSHPILKDWCDLDSHRLWQFLLTVSPPPAALPPPLVPVSVVPSSAMLALQPLPSQGIQATIAARDDISVVFLYGATQAMAMTAQASSTASNLQTLDLPSIGTLLSFYHACLGLPVKQTWLDAIKAGNCDTFYGLTYSSMAIYCPNANKIILGHLAQQRQNVRSTKPKEPKPSAPPALPTTSPSSADESTNQVFIKVYPSASCTRMMLAAFQLEHTQGTNIS
jgi:hypothetical protein